MFSAELCLLAEYVGISSESIPYGFCESIEEPSDQYAGSLTLSGEGPLPAISARAELLTFLTHLLNTDLAVSLMSFLDLALTALQSCL